MLVHTKRMMLSLAIPMILGGCGVSAADSDADADGGEEASQEQAASAADALARAATGTVTRQYASLYVKNWPDTNGRKQWTDITVNNPNPVPAQVTITIHRTGGGYPLEVITKTIPARGAYGSFGDAAWLAIDDSDPANQRSIGWIELASDVPVAATSRVALRDGSTFDAPVALLDDEAFVKSPSTRLFSSLFLKNWPAGGGAATQWTNLIVNNPGDQAATITVRVHRTDGGGVLSSLSRTLPAKGVWNSYGDAGWLGVANSDAANGRSIGWVEVLSTAPVVAMNRFTLRSGTTYSAPAVHVEDDALTSETSTTLRANLFVKNWPTNSGLSQWSSVVVNNPGAMAASLRVVVRGKDGAVLGDFTKTVPAMGYWNASGDASWAGVQNSDVANNRSVGWVEITSSQPVFGMNRVTFRDGNAASAPLRDLDDGPLQTATSRKLFAPYYLNNWPTTSGHTQWSNVIVNNPNDYPTTITVRILRKDGTGDVTFFTRQIPARGLYNAYGDPSWVNAPFTEAASRRLDGWVEITASAPVIAMDRVVHRDGSAFDSPDVLFDDNALDGGVLSACDPLGPGEFCPRSAEEVVAPFKELMIVDPAIVGGERASSAAGGHFSFRWLMEQLASPGADPSALVEQWLSAGFSAGSVNGFPVEDRPAVRALVDSWPKIPGTGRLDLSRSPFELLAIVNRVDLSSGGGAGEGRFVFGLKQGSFGAPMTVIFEYKLPASASRELWAQRFHALGAVAMGPELGARLQMITDEFTARGASPSGVNGSALGQLRTNEKLDFRPWQLREFHLVAGSPARLQITTTKQNPDESLDVSRALASFINANASGVLAGTALFPAAMLGGESNAEVFRWTVPGVSEALRHAFATQTCNGCHESEQPSLDGFYHVSPVTSGGADGTGRLSPFLLDTDLPARERFLRQTLCNGRCPGAAPVPAAPARVH
ncbi:hypothetical protein BE15_05495 [Sorangium cellulosum]|uniref:Secreted protein n=1 Tax=Sorangium cellulosum TaxID=56 RepID=A0A150QPS6_SORCE|nr:hypothetical protein BE15_05495 [Sorangium cellulosum]